MNNNICLSNENRSIDKHINKMLDYLYEETFLVDKDIKYEDENYKYFFKLLYNLFSKKRIINCYDDEVKSFIKFCVLNNDYINTNVLLDNLFKIKKTSKNHNNTFNQVDLIRLKDVCDKKILTYN